ncbi:MAG: SurA N-terminal domain-containing protein [Cocleimonas sp.]|nr:SurA N-terminal domain-containing protein [Cocleimonas sp.]
MLQNIHDKAKGWLAYTVVFLISVPFALFGINSYLGGGDTLIAATVNGEEIPAREVQNELLQQKQRLSSMMGGKLPAGFSDKMLKSQALEGLINQALIRQEAENNGYRASDIEVFSLISGTEAFQKEGKFDPQTYTQLLAANRRNKGDYEATLRKDISNRQFLNGIMETSFIPDTQAARYQALSQQKRDFETFTLKLADYKAEIKPTDDAVKAYYEAHSKQYMTEEKIKISYVRLKVDDLLASVEIPADALQTFYDENTSQYVVPEQRKVSHILIKAEADEKAAKERAEALYQAISTGKKTFEAAAIEDSDDKIATEKAGDLGFIAIGDMGADFEKAAFALKTGELSEVVKTGSGYEIIKVGEIKEQIQKSFEQVKVEIEKDYRKEEAQKLFQQQIEKLQTVAFENEDSIDPAAQAVGLEVKISDWFTRAGGKASPDGKEITGLPKIIEQSFANTVFNDAKNSDLIEISDTDVAVIRLNAKEVPKLKPMSDVIDNIKTSIIDTEARKIVKTKGEAVVAKLRTSGNWSALSDLGANADAVEEFTAVERQSRKPSVDVVRKVFAMNRPKDNKAVFSNTILTTGDYVLVSLKTVIDGDKAVDDMSRDLFAQSLGERERSAVMRALRDEADVEIIKQNSE